MKNVRNRTIGAAVALLMAGSLTACNDSAPSASTPSGTQGTSTTTDTQTSSTTAPTSDTATSTTTTSTTADTSSAAPSTSSTSATSTGAAAASGAKCKASYVSNPSEVDDKTTVKKYGESASATDEYGRKFTVKVSEGKITEPGSDDEYSFDRSETALVFKVSIDYDPASSSVDSAYISYSLFTLRDAQNNICDNAISTSLAPDNDPLQSGSDMTKRTKHLDGTLVFKVPVGSDPKSFTLTYAANLLSNVANIGWKN